MSAVEKSHSPTILDQLTDIFDRVFPVNKRMVKNNEHRSEVKPDKSAKTFAN